MEGEGQPESWVSLHGEEEGRVQGADSSSLLITQLRQSDAGSYKCVVTNSAGATESLPAAVTVGKSTHTYVRMILGGEV